jgi:hypothetical protein
MYKCMTAMSIMPLQGYKQILLPYLLVFNLDLYVRLTSSGME